MSTALGVAVSLGAIAFYQHRQAQRSLEDQIYALSQSSETFMSSDCGFEALLSAMRAAQPILDRQLQERPETRIRVTAVLMKAIHQARERNRLEGHTGEINHVTFSPNGQIIATASADNTIKLWDRQGKLLRTLTDHPQVIIRSISFSPDGKMIATTGLDTPVKLWNLDSQKITYLENQSSMVLKVSFSPDGKTVATFDNDGTVQLWSLEGKELATLPGYKSLEQDISFSPDGKSLAISNESAATVVNFDLQELGAIACQWLRNYLQHNPNVAPSDSLRISCA